MALFAALACAWAAGACGGGSSPSTPTTPTIPATTPAAVSAMLNGLSGEISSSLQTLQADLPRNPGIATQIQAKIAMLQGASLASDVINGGFWASEAASSLDGRQVPVTVVFAQANMRAEASDAVHDVVMALPVLEGFMATALPAAYVRIWYGFIIGNSGGSGVIHTEDQGSYEARKTTSMVPYEPVLDHELSHTYVGHESLNQFLELYVYNVVHTNSTDVQAWLFTRNYVAWQDANTGVQALLDIYQLIGREAMARAYRTIYALRPPYGQPLSDQCKQAFVDQAADALKAQVATKAATITY
jgi:hypothetical protein